VGSATGAWAQGHLEATYEASLAGIRVGKGTWIVDVAEDQYTARAIGGSSGLLKMVSSGDGSGLVQGRIVNGQLSPAAYISTTSAEKKSQTVRMVLASGNVKNVAIEPEPPLQPERIPLQDAHKQGVIDPMSGLLVQVPGTVDPVGPQACRDRLPVFDGRFRFDLALSFKRIEMVRAERGYAGPVVVCGVGFTPLAGYIPDRPAIKHLMSERGMEAWFAPIAGTRTLVPYRVSVPTPFGVALLQATQFVSSPLPSRTTARAQ
jgi:hypothetical protein